jgi:polar amino acid transport system substrate-binding protein
VRRWFIAVAVLVAVLGAACGDDAVVAPRTTEGTDVATDGEATEGPECTPETLPVKEPGTLTVGADSPAFPPYFVDNDPTNGQGFESAVAYAVAERLGFSEDQVTWTVVPFNASFAPGPKDFDFYITQVSIRPRREEAVDFSIPYYTSNQAIIALDSSPVAGATSIEDLRTAKLGAQIGTTSLEYIQTTIQPEQQPFVYDTTSDAKSALEAGQVDGLVLDLPTAYFITAVEIPEASIVGQFTLESGGATDEWGLVMEEGSELRTCVDQALQELIDDGTLAAITEEWMSGGGEVPTLE